jgi:hypothetical protein
VVGALKLLTLTLKLLQELPGGSVVRVFLVGSLYVIRYNLVVA